MVPDIRLRHATCADSWTSLGDQPVHQVGPHAVEGELGDVVGGALLGGALALTGELLAAWWPMDAVVGEAQASGLLVELAVAAVVDREAAIENQATAC